METKDWHFPMACPKCRALAGTPFRVKTADANELSADIRCAACQHEWAISAPSPSLFLPRKPDRRADVH